MWSGFNKPTNASIEIEMPNGSNWYILEGSKIPSNPSKPLGFPLLESEEQRKELLKAINTELTSPQSEINPAVHLIMKNNLLVPVNNRGYPISGREHSRRWGRFVDELYNPPDNKGKRSIKKLKPLPKPSVTPFSMGEPLTTSISIPSANNEIEAEYYAKAGFIEACINNQWLIPFVNRLGWRYHNGVATITVPFWKNDDLYAWDNIEYENPLPPKSREKGFLLSNGDRYPYPNDIAVENTNVLSTNPNIGIVDGVEFNLNDVIHMNYPKTNRKQRTIAKIAKEIREGLIPFDPPYPIVDLDDADERIDGMIIGGIAVIYIKPNELIIGKHNPPLLSKALGKYKQLWNDGELLNDYGHATYTDSYSIIDERGVVFLELTDSEI